MSTYSSGVLKSVGICDDGGLGQVALSSVKGFRNFARAAFLEGKDQWLRRSASSRYLGRQRGG